MHKVIANREGTYNETHCMYIDNDILFFDTAAGRYGVGHIHLSELKAKIAEYENAAEPVVNLRKSYFAFRDRLHDEYGTGYSKVELHELAKKYIFPKLIENPDNFTDIGKQQSELSVTWLSEQGWKSYIEEFKLFCAENFNFYL